jgi:predicted glycosyltransferase
MKIWFDLCHPPHVLFFAPQIRELERRGHQTFITVRDRFQVAELCRLEGLSFSIIGHDYGKHAVSKAAGFLRRSLQLALAARNRGISVAASQGSSYQVLAARLLGIPVLFMTDYEHIFLRVANFFATRICVPNVIPDQVLVQKKIPRSKILKYPGLKEDVYVHEFRPDSGIFAELGIDPERVIVTLRAPSTQAHYRSAESEKLFDDVLNYLLCQKNISIVFLPRSEDESVRVQRRFHPHRDKIRIPSKAIHALNLIWHSDLIIGGGGTMNREAASLGIPVYTIFRGRQGAVDRFLSNSNRMAFIKHERDLDRIKIRKRPGARPLRVQNRSFKLFLVDQIVREARTGGA